MQTIHEALEKLQTSKFRSSFRLTKKDKEQLNRYGFEKIKQHARDFVRLKIATYDPEKDGKQTPMHGSPVFKAMHATASCCRGCLEKWYKVPKERPLTGNEQERLVNLLMAWLEGQIEI